MKKWFKKDCSAALLVPKVTVAALPSSAALFGRGGDEGPPSGAPPPPPALVLRMVNPQQGTVLRLRVARDDSPAAAETAGSSGGADENPRQAAGVRAAGGDVVVAAAGGVAEAASVMVVRTEGWKEGDLLRLEGKEDEVLRQPGDRHRLPEGTLSQAAGGGAQDSDAGSAAGGPSFLVHQQGDVAWVRVTLDEASVSRVASAAASAAATTGSSAKAPLLVDVRFALVMAEGEEGEGAGGASEDVSMPISVRFPLSRCPA